MIWALFIGLCRMQCVFKARINHQFNRPGNLKGVAGFKKQTNCNAVDSDKLNKRHALVFTDR